MGLQGQINNIKDMLINEMHKKGEIIFNGLLNQPPEVTIPEELFVNYFLPCFLGNINTPSWVVEWISISGGPMAEVGVIGKNREILYVVPGILNTNNLLLSNAGGNLSDVFARYNMITNNIPAQGTTFLNQAFDNKTKEILSNYSPLDAHRKWGIILHHYGLIKENVLPNTAAQDIGDSFEY